MSHEVGLIDWYIHDSIFLQILYNEKNREPKILEIFHFRSTSSDSSNFKDSKIIVNMETETHPKRTEGRVPSHPHPPKKKK